MEGFPSDWNLEDIDRMLELLPLISAPNFAAATWTEPDVGQAPYPNYDSVVERWRDLVATSSAQNDPYRALPEDTGMLVDGGDTRTLLQLPGDFAVASIDQIRRYFAMCLRAERFGDGFIAGEFQRGNIQAALSRVKSLQGQI